MKFNLTKTERANHSRLVHKAGKLAWSNNRLDQEVFLRKSERYREMTNTELYDSDVLKINWIEDL